MKLFDKDMAAGSICVCAGENTAVAIAVDNLAADIEKVCGFRPSIVHQMDESVRVVVGTLGVSPFTVGMPLERLKDQDGKLRWEGYLQKEQDGRLYLAGCDRRGTVYAIYDFCERIGVSPWYYWADVPVKTKDAVIIEPGWYKTDWPCVRYRGIFLNDEEELDMWAKLHTEDGTIGPEAYRRIFELILRLKGNLIWPAMHVNAFNRNPENGRLAERMGIVTGTSHCDMLHRNNQNEWADWVAGKGYEGLQYDYTIEGWNREKLKEYWRESLNQNRDFEACYTIGMRGIHDSGLVMQGFSEKSTEEETLRQKRRLLEQIMEEQRNLIREVLGREDVPQIFVPYKEVLPIYDSGLRVPEDVTLIWVDDNHGYMRRYPNENEQRRAGGNGLYYHSSYWAPPGMSYLFLCSIPLAQMGNELKKCYAQGIREIWVDNVGALKPLEQDMEYFLRYGWDAGRPESAVHDAALFTQEWIDRNFTGSHGKETADIYTEFAQLNNVCKPEHLTSGKFSQTAYGDEAGARVWKLYGLVSRAKRIYDSLPMKEKDAYFELMLMKIQAAFYINASYYFADRSIASFDRGAMRGAEAYLGKSREMDGLKRMLLYYYNEKLCGGKWSGILTPEDFPPPTLELYPACKPALKLEAGELLLRTADFGETGILRFDKDGLRTKWFELSNTGIGSIPFQIVCDPDLELSEREGTVEVEKRIFVTPKENYGGGEIRVLAAGKTWHIPVVCGQAASADGYLHIPACDYQECSDGWNRIEGLGRGQGSIMEADAGNWQEAPWLEFGFSLRSEGSYMLEIIRYLTLNSTGQIRMRITVDGGWQETAASETVDEWKGSWKEAVLDDGEKLFLQLPFLEKGEHTLRLEALDPYVSIFALNLYFAPLLWSNLGPGVLDVNVPIPDFDAMQFCEMYGLTEEEIPLPAVVYAGRRFWTEDVLYARNERYFPVKTGRQRYHPAADGTMDRIAAFGRGSMQEREGHIAWEAEYALEQSADAWMTTDTEGNGWTHRQAETDGRTGLAMCLPGKQKTWADEEDAPVLHYRLCCSHGGLYQVWLLMKYDGEIASRCGFLLDGDVVPKERLVREGNFFTYRTEHMWCWQRMAEVYLKKGEHVFGIIGAGSGLCIDRIYMTLGEENPPLDEEWETVRGR